MGSETWCDRAFSKQAEVAAKDAEIERLRAALARQEGMTLAAVTRHDEAWERGVAAERARIESALDGLDLLAIADEVLADRTSIETADEIVAIVRRALLGAAAGEGNDG